MHVARRRVSRTHMSAPLDRPPSIRQVFGKSVAILLCRLSLVARDRLRPPRGVRRRESLRLPLALVLFPTFAMSVAVAVSSPFNAR